MVYLSSIVLRALNDRVSAILWYPQVFRMPLSRWSRNMKSCKISSQQDSRKLRTHTLSMLFGYPFSSNDSYSYSCDAPNPLSTTASPCSSPCAATDSQLHLTGKRMICLRSLCCLILLHFCLDRSWCRLKIRAVSAWWKARLSYDFAMLGSQHAGRITHLLGLSADYVLRLLLDPRLPLSRNDLACGRP